MGACSAGGVTAPYPGRVSQAAEPSVPRAARPPCNQVWGGCSIAAGCSSHPAGGNDPSLSRQRVQVEVLLVCGVTSPLGGSRLLPGLPKNKTLVMFCCCRAGQPVAQALAGASCSAGLLGEGGVWGYRPVGRAVRAPRVCLVSCVLRDPLYSGGNVAPAFQRHGAARCGAGLAPSLDLGLAS